MVPKMVELHDFKKFPELTNAQLQVMPFASPHEQITADFTADVVAVHDGDTIRLETDFRDFNFPLRLLDIDAPEMNAGGKDAREWLRGRILEQVVYVLIDHNNRVDKWGRLLGRVLHRGMDVGEEELRNGLATPFSRRREGQIPDVNKELAVKKWL